jgi:hypothetical protein
MDTQRIIEAILVLTVILSPLWLIRPFRYETADLEAHRQRKAGNRSARAVRKWYGWVVETKK